MTGHSWAFFRLLQPVWIRFLPIVFCMASWSLADSTDENCGQSFNVTPTNPVILKSPNHPSQYNNHAHCEYDFNGPDGTRLKFSYLTFEVEDRSTFYGHCHDQLILKETVNGTEYETRRTVNCGILRGKVIFSKTNYVRGVFTSDATRTFRGFRIQIEAIGGPTNLPDLSHSNDWTTQRETNFWDDDYSTATPPTTISALKRIQMMNQSFFRCSTAMRIDFNETKYIASPNYPEKYANSLYCAFPIQGPEGSVLQFDTEDFSLEGQTPPVCRDTFSITDYPSLYQGRSVMYCGSKGPDQYRSATNNVRVRFITDVSVTDRGYNISVSAIPVQPEITNVPPGSTGTFTSPNYPQPYPLLSNRTYHFITAPDYRLLFQSDKLHIEYDASCMYDYLEFMEFDNYTSKFTRPLGRRFCGAIPNFNLQSDTNQVVVNFVTDSTSHWTGFNISVQAISKTPPLYNVSANGTIYLTSLNYPRAYAPSTKTTYNILAPSGYVLQFSSVSFDVEGPLSEKCPHDYLQFFERRAKKVIRLDGPERFCGRIGPEELRSTTRYVKAIFFTDDSLSLTGFNISIKAVPLTSQQPSLASKAARRRTAFLFIVLGSSLHLVVQNLSL
ncbi:hypothetical protein RvY_03733 [Ramazzottius varieornatus]|uniref:CUB domain-containing protein n=1 Tax=Ramazzottius varieornatus TaxID=947166 RepID=A0A1D1UYH7_RAMVA|nr:hypothetical protein RvY_03733 [Ramazzottius varieornatus]